MTHNGAIGVFDSGVGGLSVLRELRIQLPHEPLLYVADSGNCPYGGRGDAFIQARSRTITEFLLDQGAKAIVIACNTATAAAATTLRATYPCPIIGMEPAIKPAVAVTRSGVIGVLATVGTVRSARMTGLIERFGRGVEVLTQPCPGLMERVEAGDLDGPQTRALLHHFVSPLMERGADVLVLGCTHYPFLRSTLLDLVGRDVVLIDTGAAVARYTERLLVEHALLAGKALGTVRMWTSASPTTTEPVVERLWGTACEVEALPTTVSTGFLLDVSSR